MLQQNPLTRLHRGCKKPWGSHAVSPNDGRPDGKLTEDFSPLSTYPLSPVPIYMPGKAALRKRIKDVGGQQTHAYLSKWCSGVEWSPEQETNERQMECLSEEGCKSRSKICKTGGDK